MNRKQFLEKASEFPAQELWIDQNNHFWAFQKELERSSVLLTEGRIVEENLEYVSRVIPLPLEQIEEYVESQIRVKMLQGYRCLASSL